MHEDTYQLSLRAGGSITTAGVLGLLTNTTVAAADTLDGLDAAVDAALVHADQFGYKGDVKRAWHGQAAITDATVLGLTTVAGLSGLTARGSDTTSQNLLPEN